MALCRNFADADELGDIASDHQWCAIITKREKTS